MSERTLMRVVRAGCVSLTTFMSLVSSAAPASETQTYRYDALGRLISSTASGGPNSGTQVDTQFDPAGNRLRYQVASGGGAGCTLAAASDAASNDDSTVYTYVERLGDCSSAVSVDYSVQVLSNGASYTSAAWFGGFGATPTSGPIQPTEANPARRWIRVWSSYGSVQPGNPLVLRVTWRVTSGNATLSRASSLITFYNSDCGC